MVELFKTFLAKFFKVFGLAFTAAFCMIQLPIGVNTLWGSDVLAEDLFPLWLVFVIFGGFTLLLVSFNEITFFVTPTALFIIVLITPFIKSYLVVLGIAVLWLGYELYIEEWFIDFGWHIEDCIEERKKVREKRLSEKE